MAKATKAFTILTLGILGLFSQPLLAQEQPLKDLVEHTRDRKYALYPSTLRMINLKKDPAYNDLVSGIEKALIYQLDSAAKASRSYLAINQVYAQLGYEEYASAIGGTLNMAILGKAYNGGNEFVGFYADGSTALAFYLRGTVDWAKIPDLMRNFQSMELLDVFDQ